MLMLVPWLMVMELTSLSLRSLPWELRSLAIGWINCLPLLSKTLSFTLDHPNSAFIAMQIFVGNRPRPRLWMYWSEDPRFHDSFISSIMTIARLKNLSRYFHCRNTSQAPPRGQAGFDPLYKVRNVIATTQETFRAGFQAQRKLSVDKAMVGFKQYMPAKPTKWGIKVWTAADARLGYCLGYDIYTGKASRRDPRRPLGFGVVDSLCRPHYHQGHHVYMDRFFNSVELAEHLLHDIFLRQSGTMLSKRSVGRNSVVTPAANLVPNVLLYFPLDHISKADRRVLMYGHFRISKHFAQAFVLERCSAIAGAAIQQQADFTYQAQRLN
ncbi:hypothetical protein EGW08_020992 [Elysia chlorotica]|uniref:PiggyBac transposable element-derived protein domain-containing protein n=1 Tax=Elysia chlorotica TaxID=188477 RepID=A0A433SPT8_ELYCH|nr:hypothetical protein EGW08_020992 [Elysia chlorotica]